MTQIKQITLLCVMMGALGTSSCGRSTAYPQGDGPSQFLSQPKHFDHVVIIVLENDDAQNVMAIPYMDSLSRRGALLENFFALAHPSYPNYLAMVSGRTFLEGGPIVQHDPIAYSRRDFGDAQMLVDAPTLADRFESRHISWQVLADDYPLKDSVPDRCDFRRAVGAYSRKHVPFLSFKEFHDRPGLCSHVRNLEWLRLESLPAYSLIIPNMIHDAHDAPLKSQVPWLRNLVAQLVDNPFAPSTLIVVTFDESGSSIREKMFGAVHPNRIYTVLLGDMVRSGFVSTTPATHLSLLLTIELNFALSPSLTPPGTRPILDVWR